MTDFTCAAFRIKRDIYQRERHKQVLPQLKAQLSSLEAQIGALKHLRGERVNVGLEEEIKALSFDKQYVWAQLQILES